MTALQGEVQGESTLAFLDRARYRMRLTGMWLRLLCTRGPCPSMLLRLAQTGSLACLGSAGCGILRHHTHARPDHGSVVGSKWHVSSHAQAPACPALPLRFHPLLLLFAQSGLLCLRAFRTALFHTQAWPMRQGALGVALGATGIGFGRRQEGVLSLEGVPWHEAKHEGITTA